MVVGYGWKVSLARGVSFHSLYYVVLEAEGYRILECARKFFVIITRKNDLSNKLILSVDERNWKRMSVYA